MMKTKNLEVVVVFLEKKNRKGGFLGFFPFQAFKKAAEKVF